MRRKQLALYKVKSSMKLRIFSNTLFSVLFFRLLWVSLWIFLFHLMIFEILIVKLASLWSFMSFCHDFLKWRKSFTSMLHEVFQQLIYFKGDALSFGDCRPWEGKIRASRLLANFGQTAGSRIQVPNELSSKTTIQ